MPRGLRLDGVIAQLVHRAIPLQANIYKTWPNLASPISVTPAASPGGSWVEFISAAAAPTQPFSIAFVGIIDNNGSAVAFEIGVGSAGSEVVRGHARAATVASAASGLYPVIPLPVIPGGSRVAIRGIAPSGVAASLVQVVSCLLPPTVPSLAQLPKLATWYPGTGAFGSLARASATSSASANTYGSWAQIIDNATETGLDIITNIIWATDFAAYGQVGFGYGGAGSETTFAEFPTGYVIAGYAPHLPVPILYPGSTRLAVRFACGSASGDARDVGLSTIKGGTYL